MKATTINFDPPELFCELDKKKYYLRDLSTSGTGAEKYFAEEVLRFLSFAGSMFATFNTQQEVNNDVDYNMSFEMRSLSHVLIRTLIEKFFKVLWLFNEPSETEIRYQAILDDFKKEYIKLYNDRNMPSSMQKKLVDLNQLKPETTNIQINIADIVPALKNKTTVLPEDIDEDIKKFINNEKDFFGDLYYLFRITSFDTHGNNSRSIISSSFEKNNGVEIYDFPFIYIDRLLLFMTVKYHLIIDEIQRKIAK